MEVTYKLYVPVYVTVDFATKEVSRVTVDDCSPVGGWKAVRGDVFFDDWTGGPKEVSLENMTGGQKLALKKALEVANDTDQIWPGWDWGG